MGRRLKFFFQRGAIKKESVTKVGLVDQPTSSSPPTTLLNLFPFTFSHIIIFLRRFKRAAGLNGRVLCVCPAQGLDIRYFSILGNCILQHSVTVFARGLVFININHQYLQYFVLYLLGSKILHLPKKQPFVQRKQVSAKRKLLQSQRGWVPLVIAFIIIITNPRTKATIIIFITI